MKDDIFGYVLHPVDLATNKAMAAADWRALASAEPIASNAVMPKLRAALNNAETFASRMPIDKIGLLFLRDGHVLQPDPSRLGTYQTHAGQTRGHWPTNPDITAAMLERYHKSRTARRRSPEIPGRVLCSRTNYLYVKRVQYMRKCDYRLTWKSEMHSAVSRAHRSVVIAFAAFVIATPGLAAELMRPAQQNALVRKYCAVCHTDAAKNGGLSLEHYDAAYSNPALAAMLLSKLQNAAMGAAGLGIPDKPTRDAWVEATAAQAQGANTWTVTRADAPGSNTPVLSASIVRDVPSREPQVGVPCTDWLSAVTLPATKAKFN